MKSGEPKAKSEGRVANGEKRPSRRSVFVVWLFALLFLPNVWLRADQSAAQHYQTGLTYERLGRYDEAYTELQLAFALDQSNPQLALALGIVASRLGRLEIALRALEHSIALDPSSVASYYHLALLYEKNSSNDRALDAWHRFLSLSQDESLKQVAKKHIQYLGGQ